MRHLAGERTTRPRATRGRDGEASSDLLDCGDRRIVEAVLNIADIIRRQFCALGELLEGQVQG